MSTDETALEQDRALQRNAYRGVRPLAIAVIGIVITFSFQVRPGPGAHGAPLGIALGLGAFGLGTIGIMRSHDAAVLLQALLMLVAIAGCAALIALQPNGAAFLGIFPAVSAGALRLPSRVSATIVGSSLVAITLAWTIGADRPAAAIIINGLGVLAFYTVALFARRMREANERARRLVVELEASRAAQAEAAAMAERQRLAREMHDVLAHSLSGLMLNLESARLLTKDDGVDPRLGDAISRAHRLAKGGLEEARRAIAMLRDDVLPGPEKLTLLTREFEDDTGIPCRLVVEGEARELDADATLACYRVAQEALTNIRKHARAQQVELRLRFLDGRVSLRVENFDSGHTGPLPGIEGSGYGLTGMRERAKLIGGSLDASPTEKGFVVTLEVPA